MGTKDKLIDRFGNLPKDFTFDEALKLLAVFGYTVHHKRATSGSRIRFKNEQNGQYIDIHKSHPASIMKEWMMKTSMAISNKHWKINLNCLVKAN